MLEKQQAKLKELIKDLEKACEDNPADAQAFKKCADAWVRLSEVARAAENGIGLNELIEAKSKLKQAVKIDPEDREAKWQLGEVYTYMNSKDFNRSEDLLKKRCTKAMELFMQVRSLDPDFCKDSGEFENTREDLEYFRNHPAKDIALKLSAMQVDLRRESFTALEAIRENRNDVKNWINWCKVSVRSKGILNDNELNKDMLCEAKQRLKKTLEIDPNDLEARWYLGEVYILIANSDSSIFQSRALYNKLCTKAVDCFDGVRSVEYEYQLGSTGPLEARQGLNRSYF